MRGCLAAKIIKAVFQVDCKHNNNISRPYDGFQYAASLVKSVAFQNELDTTLWEKQALTLFVTRINDWLQIADQSTLHIQYPVIRAELCKLFRIPFTHILIRDLLVEFYAWLVKYEFIYVISSKPQSSVYYCTVLMYEPLRFIPKRPTYQWTNDECCIAYGFGNYWYNALTEHQPVIAAASMRDLQLVFAYYNRRRKHYQRATLTWLLMCKHYLRRFFPTGIDRIVAEYVWMGRFWDRDCG